MDPSRDLVVVRLGGEVVGYEEGIEINILSGTSSSSCPVPSPSGEVG